MKKKKVEAIYLISIFTLDHGKLVLIGSNDLRLRELRLHLFFHPKLNFRKTNGKIMNVIMTCMSRYDLSIRFWDL